MYQYKMVQIPPGIAVRASEHRGNEAAAYLEEIVNDYAEEGWEFYRIDSMDIQVQPGCLGALFGKKGDQDTYYVITFRRPRS